MKGPDVAIVIVNKVNFNSFIMDDKWSIDFKKFKKSSSKKLIKGGLGFFLSPREETKDNGSSSKNYMNLTSAKKSNNWDSEGLNVEPSSNEIEVQEKDYIDGKLKHRREAASAIILKQNIPVIPSLDDFADDDLTNQIAKAPLVAVKKVASYKDLETDILRHSAFASLEEVNVQLLIKLLHPESCLDEPDTSWTREGLFNEVVSIFNERKS